MCNKAKPSGTAHSNKPKNRTIQKIDIDLKWLRECINISWKASNKNTLRSSKITDQVQFHAQMISVPLPFWFKSRLGGVGSSCYISSGKKATVIHSHLLSHYIRKHAASWLLVRFTIPAVCKTMGLKLNLKLCLCILIASVNQTRWTNKETVKAQSVAHTTQQHRVFCPFCPGVPLAIVAKPVLQKAQ